MPEPNLPPPVLVAEAAGLERLLAALAGAPAVGVDTESNSLHAYRERVCLIQFSIPGGDYIVDPLVFDATGGAAALQPLGPLFADPARQKVFHAAEYDVICLKRDFGFEINNLFDTMSAARTLGWTQLGLGALLEARFGVQLNKRFQRANWGQRPLTAELLDYARLDTHYLVRLRDELAEALRAAGRVDEALEEFARLERVAGANGGAPGDDEHAFWRVNGARDLKPAQAAVLREAWRYREQQAHRADRPPFKIMGDETLLAVAEAEPHSMADLKGLPGMTPSQMRRHGAQLLATVRRGLAGPPARPPRYEREPDEVRERYERLHQWRKARAKARGVESDVIVPREALWELARRNPRSLAELEAMAHLGPWRRAHTTIRWKLPSTARRRRLPAASTC
jgi:ribonuclease D